MTDQSSKIHLIIPIRPPNKPMAVWIPIQGVRALVNGIGDDCHVANDAKSTTKIGIWHNAPTMTNTDHMMIIFHVFLLWCFRRWQMGDLACLQAMDKQV